MDKYDENIIENNFFKYLKTKHEDVMKEAIHNKYIICIPKADVIQELSLDIVLDHILIPLEEIESNTDYVTRNKNYLILNDSQLKSKEKEDRRVGILFEEIFYEDKIGKYKIVCVTNYISSLFKDDYVIPTHNESLLNNETLKYFRTVNDFVDYIMKFTEQFLLIDKIDQHLTNFLSIPFSKVSPPKTEYLRREVNVILLKSLDHIREIVIKLHDYERVTLRMCIESYILHSLYNVLFQYSTTEMALKDEKLNRLLHSLKEISLSKFDLRVSNLNCILSAKYEIAAINNFKSAFGKLQCIRRAIECFEFNSVLTSDEILSILVFIIIKCNVSNWFANLAYIKTYSFTLESSDEYSFILSSFEAAVVFIHSEDILKKGNDDTSSDIYFDWNEEASFQRNCFNSDPKDYHNETIYSLYDNIKKDNLTEVKNIFEVNIDTPSTLSPSLIENSDLCHPLCDCSKCNLILSSSSNSDMILNYDFKDENLMSPLHIASWYGSLSTVEYLLSKKACCSTQNIAGMTPLHIAAYKGNQTVLLLLLHAGCNITNVDKEGNTALLLSCKAGHDNCVKALIFYAESSGLNLDFSIKNIYGETALHLASYWGYTSIVKFLVSQPSIVGECLTIKNMRNQTPIECAHNEMISFIIKQSTESMEDNLHTNLLLLDFGDENKNVTSNDNVKQVDAIVTHESNADSACKELSLNSEMGNTLKKTLDAISVGDTKLACFYLEMHDNRSQNLNEVKCHPLCQCPDCSHISYTRVKSNYSLINYVGNEKYGPLHAAILNENFELCQILLQNGANPHLVTNTEERSSLHLVVEKENSEILKLLLKFNADVNCNDFVGNTPLHLCCISGWKEGVIILIESGARLNLNNKDGSSPKEEADKHGHIEIVGILVRKMSEII